MSNTGRDFDIQCFRTESGAYCSPGEVTIASNASYSMTEPGWGNAVNLLVHSARGTRFECAPENVQRCVDFSEREQSQADRK